MIELFDTHCHLDDEKFDPDREDAFQRLRDRGVARIVCVGSDLPTSESSIRFAQAHEHTWAACGVHPHEAAEAPEGYLDRLRELTREDRVVAIGEIGLDYYYDFSPRDVQKRVLSEQLDLACDLDMPVIFHIRDAHGDMIDLFRSRKRLPRGIIHCFSGSQETALEYVRMGFYISFSGPLTFKKAPKLQEACRIVPKDRLLIETDSPYMAPEPVRGRRNEPANVRYVGLKLAELRGETPEEVAGYTTKNAMKVYGI